MDNKINFMPYIILDYIFSIPTLASLILIFIFHNMEATSGLNLIYLAGLIPIIFKIINAFSYCVPYKLVIHSGLMEVNSNKIYQLSDFALKYEVYKIVHKNYSSYSFPDSDILYKFIFTTKNGEVVMFSVGFITQVILKKLLETQGFLQENKFRKIPLIKLLLIIILVISPVIMLFTFFKGGMNLR